MSNQVFEQYVDEHGNISVRVSQDVVVLTREDADRVKAKFDQLNADNAMLRELVLTLAFCANDEADCDQCPMNGVRCDVVQQCFCDGAAETLRELGVEVDA